MVKLFLLIASLTWLNCPAQQIPVSVIKPVELTYLHKVSFPKLFQAGDKQRFVQLCTSVVDSVIEGKVTFNKASIASIKTCSLSMQIAADTIRTYEVKTIGRKNTKRLFKETVNVYGQPAETKSEGDLITYSWKKTYGDGKYIVSTLTLDANSKFGRLLSSIE